MVSKRTILLDGKEVAIRSYEVSIWTLQDSFITVLKWAILENKGQIQKPKIILDADGTENFSFSIPMYLNPEEENPIWYNTSNGNLMIGMRKIKVILNKTLKEEKVFEFLITKVTERHERNQLYCDVECEGLAFHELGKIGYKITLSQDEFLTRYEQWFKEDGNEDTKPIQNINYWNEEFLELEYATMNQVPNKWYYKVEMNWDSYGSNLDKESNKIYEDEYVTSWEENGGKLIPSKTEASREKERPVEISESNVYNITQKIAESFGVFCRYEYGYDTNYHIISRTIVYYNNFIEEEKGHMDLTYPYHTSEITREMDSTELTTKLFVRPVDYDYSETGQVTIMSVDANKSREDYILNFDYLHKFNIITDEQYEAIADYEKDMRFLNLVLEELQRQINYLENKKNDLEAQNTILQNGSEEAEKQINEAANHLTVLLNDETGTVIVEGANAKAVIIKQDNNNGQYYITMPFIGIIPETVKLYKTFGYNNGGINLDDEVEETGIVILDTMTGDISKIVWSTALELNGVEIQTVWMTCQYVPNTYWTKVKQYWEQAKINIDNKKKNIDKQLETITLSLQQQKENQQTLLNKQKELRKEFEIMMGPALREGYWQPEEYEDYGDKYVANFNNGNQTIGLATYKFDTQQYDNDDKLTYYEGQTLKNYLVAILDNSSLSYIQENYDNLSFIYHDKAIIQLNASIENSSESQALAYIRDTKKSIRVGAGCRFGFVEYNNTIKPALIIENINSFTDDQINFLMGVGSNASLLESNPMQLGILDTNIQEVTDNNNTITKITSTVRNGAIQLNPLINSGMSAVYPRIIIDSLLLKHTTEEDLLIKFNNDILEEYKDYFILIESYIDDNNNIWKDQYFINLKPEVYFKKGILSPNVSISYSLSNASTMIYLDALEVSKENSQPKVAYTIKLSMYDPYIIHDIYNKMSKIVHINDNQLKFENVQGYISHIEMMLDTPWEDSIEVKNYKTKFEDLFSSIVAQTDAMSKKSFSYDVAAAAFNSDGSLTSTSVNKMLDSNPLIFKTYIDEYLIENEALRNMLTNVFDEAGQILSSAGNALADIKALTSTNANILSGFVRGAEEGFARGIDLISSNGTYTSAVQINRNGIFIGSDQRIALYSGIIGNESGGVSIDLNPYRLILGASSASNATAAKFTDKYLVLAAGDIITNSENNIINLDTLTVNGTINGLVGAKFTSNSFGLATLSQNILNAILMNDKGITIGSSNIDRSNNQLGQNLDQETTDLRATDGSYVRIAGTGIDIGSGANLYIQTNNLVINSEVTNNNQNIFELKKKNNDNSYDTALSYSISDGLTIKGNISADSLVIGDQTAQEQSLSEWVNAKVTPEAIWLGIKKATEQPIEGEEPSDDRQTSYLSITDNNISILSNGSLNISSGGKLQVTASNVIINTDANNGESIFKLTNGVSNNPTNYINLKKDNNGNISAQIGGWILDTHRFFSGLNNNYVALDSGTEINNNGTIVTEPYALWCGSTTSSTAPFRVKRNGGVYLNSLMVLDKKEENSWGLGGTDADHEGIYTITEGTEEEQGTYGYKAIDFSKLNFKQAVSVTGSWSGATFNAKVSLWGILNRTINNSATISMTKPINVQDVSQGGSDCRALIPITLAGGGNIETQLEGYVNASNVYNAGWGAAVSKGSNWSSRTLQAGRSITISVPSSTVDSGTSFTITAASSGSGGGGCFVAGTKIKLTNNQNKTIESLNVGDIVIAYDESTNTFVESEVRAIQMFKHKKNIYRIKLNSIKEIVLTDSHPLLTNEGWKAINIEAAKREHFIDVEQLQVNDKIKTMDGYDIVQDIIFEEKMNDTTVYNIDVEPYDTYIVEGVVVHNAEVKPVDDP